MKLGKGHKTRFWYRLGVFSKFSDEHPRHPDFPRVPLFGISHSEIGFFFQSTGQKPALLKEEKNIHITSFRLIGVLDLYRRTSYATSSYKRPPPTGDHQSSSYLNTNISPVKSQQLTPLENDQPF